MAKLNRRITVEWLGISLEPDEINWRMESHYREFTRSEYEAAGWPGDRRYTMECKCPRISAELRKYTDVHTGAPWDFGFMPFGIERMVEYRHRALLTTLRLKAEHAYYEMRGDTLVVSEASSNPFTQVRPA